MHDDFANLVVALPSYLKKKITFDHDGGKLNFPGCIRDTELPVNSISR